MTQKQIEKRVQANELMIKEIERNMETLRKIEQQWYKEQISYEQFCKARTAAGFDTVNSGAYMSTKIENLKKWNELLQGGKIYFNGTYYTDLDPFEVVEVVSPTRVILREMKATPAEGAEPMSNKWDITSDPNGEVISATIRVTKWGVNVRRDGNSDYRLYMRHEPRYYYDYDF